MSTASPTAFRAWLVYKNLVNVILINDGLNYLLLGFKCFHLPRRRAQLAGAACSTPWLVFLERIQLVRLTDTRAQRTTTSHTRRALALSVSLVC